MKNFIKEIKQASKEDPFGEVCLLTVICVFSYAVIVNFEIILATTAMLFYGLFTVIAWLTIPIIVFLIVLALLVYLFT